MVTKTNLKKDNSKLSLLLKKRIMEIILVKLLLLNKMMNLIFREMFSKLKVKLAIKQPILL
jgi:hypothetical protein